MLVAVLLLVPRLGLASERYRIETDAGAISIELAARDAPNTVAAFRDLVARKLYQGTTFHRVIPGYIIQGGSPTSRDADPANDGYGRPERLLALESNGLRHVRGAVAMARDVRDAASVGSQFFIVLSDAPMLDSIGFSVFARVVDGMEVADRIAEAPRDIRNHDRPLEPVTILGVHPTESASAAPFASRPDPAAFQSAPESTTPEPVPTPTPTPPPSTAPEPRARVRDARANVRGGPSTAERIVGRAHAGDVLPVVGERDGWVEVELEGGVRGFLREDLVEILR